MFWMKPRQQIPIWPSLSKLKQKITIFFLLKVNLGGWVGLGGGGYLLMPEISVYRYFGILQKNQVN
ncbi:hypothetical protein GAMM_10086 [Gammaproteobacteria bacterium]